MEYVSLKLQRHERVDVTARCSAHLQPPSPVVQTLGSTSASGIQMPYCLAINVSTSIAVKRKQTSQLFVSVEQALSIESLTDALSSTGCNGLLSGGCRQLKRLPGMTAVGIEILGIEMLGIQTERAPPRAAHSKSFLKVRASTRTE